MKLSSELDVWSSTFWCLSITKSSTLHVNVISWTLKWKRVVDMDFYKTKKKFYSSKEELLLNVTWYPWIHWLDLCNENSAMTSDLPSQIKSNSFFLFLYPHHLTFWECINTGRRNCTFIISTWKLKFLYIELSILKRRNGKLTNFVCDL